jgi:hypothetical protein
MRGAAKRASAPTFCRASAMAASAMRSAFAAFTPAVLPSMGGSSRADAHPAAAALLLPRCRALEPPRSLGRSCMLDTSASSPPVAALSAACARLRPLRAMLLQPQRRQHSA